MYKGQGAASPETKVRFSAASSGTMADKLWEDLDSSPKVVHETESMGSHGTCEGSGSPTETGLSTNSGIHALLVGHATLKQEPVSALAQSSL